MNTLPPFFPVASHTDQIGLGSIFVAIKGFEKDGAHFIPLAIEKGAVTVVIDQEAHLPDHVSLLIQKHGVLLQRVADTRLALAQLSAQAAGYPAAHLKIIGITGTKGKTTTSFLLWHLLKTAGYKAALLSTVNNYIGDEKYAAPLTTAQPDYLHQFLKVCIERGVTHVVMEVAAQALSLHRVHGIQFDGIIFTNFSLEHLEFYPDMESYFAAKCMIFDAAKPGAPILVNRDDAWCKKIKRMPTMQEFGSDRTCPALIGSFNAYNVTAAANIAAKLGVAEQKIEQGLATFTGVRGRFERHELPNGALCIIDYAHNPSSYQSVLSALRTMTDHLIVVFGCGGRRDPSKRPIMGGLAAQFADIVILTSDNPRTEDPQAIMADIERGIEPKNLNKVIKILDRKDAMKKSYQLSKKGSIVALLGKGPDEYQIIGDQKLPFKEAEIMYALSQGNEHEKNNVG